MSELPASDMLVFPIPARAWSTNQERKMHHMQRAGLTKLWKEAAFWHAKQRGLRSLGPSYVSIAIPFADKRRRDPHNYCATVMKAVIDGLVAAGCWPDDTAEYVRHIEPELVSGDKVTITITPRS